MWPLYLILSILFLRLYNMLTRGKCYSDGLLNGKVAVVTGATDGLGYATALELARRGANLVLACPGDSAGSSAVATIVKLTGNKNVRCIHLDLTSLDSVRTFVEEFKRNELRLDILIHGAATGGGCRRTGDGINECMQVNHFAPFLLTVLLVPVLRRSEPSRVVTVSSHLHRYGTVQDVEGPRSPWRRYCDSKLCNVLFSNELARRLTGTGVVANCLHPGYVATRDSPTVAGRLRRFFQSIVLKSPEEAAQTVIQLAVAEECDQITGKYFADCSESAASADARSDTLANQLWTLSERTVRLRPEDSI